MREESLAGRILCGRKPLGGIPSRRNPVAIMIAIPGLHEDPIPYGGWWTLKHMELFTFENMFDILDVPKDPSLVKVMKLYVIQTRRIKYKGRFL